MAPQKGSWLYYFGFISSSIVASLGRGSQGAKIFASFHDAFSDFYLAHELIFSGPAGSESAPQPIASFPLPNTPLDCETIMSTHSLSLYSQSLSGRSSDRQHKYTGEFGKVQWRICLQKG